MRAYAEWEKQELLFLSLPHKSSDWSEYLDEILASYEELIAAIVPFQKVVLIAPNQSCFERFKKFKNTQFVCIDTDDTWIRDYGMIDVQNGDKIISYDFKFNAWGGKFQSSKDNAVNRELVKKYATNLKEIDFILEGGSIDFNGAGTMLTTSECLLNDNRNANFSKDEIDVKLKELFGLKRIIWLEHGFIKGDDTDSHVDTLARFITADTIAYVSCDDESDEHFDELRKMHKELEKTGFKLLPLPLPKAKFYNGKRLGCTYANFIFINDALIVPTYNDENDKLVLDRLSLALPDRKVLGVNSLIFVRQNGSLHCSSQNRFLGAR
ncbi:agmatine deiminase family protein [Campylobacter sp. faydin G-105]|uniref:agmatine deiminase family protein n=1 Tax=Campylobacter anatolicus TaxID=2829105 RepID=UPI001B9793D1|nr:agmatine deiminase family protein [Campylobacter anatolicus]MBR8462054.1 agmatine deiminase family protein [Campylobacter anatolicus]